MSQGLYSHTTRAIGTILTAAIYNADHQNHITNLNPQMIGGLSDTVAEMQAMTDPGGVGSESLAGNLEGEFRHLRFAIDRIVGGTQWYEAPAVSLADVDIPTITAFMETLLDDADAAAARATLLALGANTEDQTIAGGARVTVKDLGVITTGTVTPDPGDRPMQRYTNGGAHTLAPGSDHGNYLLTIVNNASAGAITTSGWTKVVGSFTTTNAHKFRCSCSIDSDGSLLIIQALQ